MRSREYFPAESLPSRNLLFAVSFAAKKECVSRDIPAPETGLHRIYRDLHRGLGAWDVTAAIAIVFLGKKTLRLKAWGVNTKPPSKSFVILRNSACNLLCP
jgi:hypothetical protein